MSDNFNHISEEVYRYILLSRSPQNEVDRQEYLDKLNGFNDKLKIAHSVEMEALAEKLKRIKDILE